ncbi:MAG: hypothetical protein LQ343_007021 [Gyalolechia ehrenbergii]|nr:MAG: hypothetical protein LQ343_007021 [Gyalolechia ehrenbergii]
MQHGNDARRRRGRRYATGIAKKLMPHYGPSPSFGFCDMKSAPSDMASSTADVQHDFLQIVDGVIGASLIDNVVKSLADESAAQAIYTEFKWTTACEDLLRTYREQIHPNIISRPQIATFVKPHTETQRTFKIIARINPGVQEASERGIGLPTDYHIIIPLVPQGLPTWAESRSTKTRQKVPWKKGSVVCIRGGTNLICTRDGGGIYIMIGGETKKQP